MKNTQKINSISAFEGDRYIKEEFEKLVKKFEIKTIVETGTFRGDTTKELSKMVDFVYSIESNKEYYDIASKNLKECNNVNLLFGNSPVILNKILPKIRKPILFYLDAHWYRYWPILDELQAISNFKDCKNSVIVIHDFYVPNSNFGYDSYYPNTNFFICWFKVIINKLSRLILGKDFFKKQGLDYEYIKEKLFIYNPEYKHYYNKKAEGKMRGVIYITP